MPYIGNIPAEKYAAFNVQYFTTSATDTYTLDRAVANELDIRLVINNVIQEPGAGKAYTAAGTTLTLSAATAGSDTMYCVYIGKAVQTVNPGAGSVGTTALADNAVTLGKMASGTDGNIISYDASGNPVAVATGSSGQVLTSAGAGAPPTFAAVPAPTSGIAASAIDSGTIATARLGSGTASSSTILFGDQTFKAAPSGGLVPLAQTSATGASASEVALESFADASKYAYYTVEIRFEPNTNGAGILMRYRDGSSNIDGANYRATIFESRNLNGTVNTNSVNGGWGTSDPEFVDSCSVHTHSFIMDFFPKGHGITSGSGLNYNLSIFRGLSWEWTGSAHQLRTIISNFIYDNSSSAANGFYIYPSAGTFYKYDVRAYGVKLS